MAKSGTERRLAAILAADVVGYSRLMGEDDRAALQALTERRKLFGAAVGARRGRIVNAPGDSILAEFASVIDAVQAAMEIQRACAADREAMQFRIGVNLGDVLVDDAGAIYGDGVNVAARLESLAPTGGICVSKAVYDQVNGKVEATFDNLGEKTVKNISTPVHVYSVVGLGVVVAPAAQRRTNSIAVLAFENLTGDPGQDLFCDGISEDIITDLSKTVGIAVVGRQSAFAYKGKSHDLRSVGRELGVKYVLEGSVRKAENTVRVTAQLVEAENGIQVWANRYDRALENIFLIGDEITEEIVISLDVKLSHGEEARIWRKAMRSPQARDLFNAGQNTIYLGTPAAVLRARELFLEAAQLEPDSPWALAHAATTHCLEVINGWTSDPARSLAEARRLATRASELDEVGVPGAQVALGIIALFEDRHDEALRHLAQAHELRPMCSAPQAFLSYGEMYCGRWESAVQNAAGAVELNPVFPVWYRYLMGAARHFGERDEEAQQILHAVKSANPRLIAARLALIGTQMALGRDDAAAGEAAAVMKERPDFSMARFAMTQPFRDKALRQEYLDSLRAAGLPD